MNVAITADPEVPVPPKLYGGIERIIDMLVHGLVERGHDVTLFAHRDSDAGCILQAYPGCKSRSKRDLLWNMWHVSSTIIQDDYDIVHSFGRLAYLLPVLPMRIPKLMSYQREVTDRSVTWAERLAGDTIHFSGCSRGLIQRYVDRPNWHVVYNGVRLDNYTFEPAVVADAPLIFLGRIEHIKGTHLAIEVARRSGRPLVIAGNVPEDEQHQAYFAKQIAPHVDGRQIRYVGPVDDKQKNALLGQAAALLMPILWKEPFGIVMAEALACGTPVIGLRRGSVPEVIENGRTGHVCRNVEEMVDALREVGQLDRRCCRKAAEERFSDQTIVSAYEELYYSILEAR